MYFALFVDSKNNIYNQDISSNHSNNHGYDSQWTHQDIFDWWHLSSRFLLLDHIIVLLYKFKIFFHIFKVIVSDFSLFMFFIEFRLHFFSGLILLFIFFLLLLIFPLQLDLWQVIIISVNKKTLIENNTIDNWIIIVSFFKCDDQLSINDGITDFLSFNFDWSLNILKFNVFIIGHKSTSGFFKDIKVLSDNLVSNLDVKLSLTFIFEVTFTEFQNQHIICAFHLIHW